MDLEQHAHFSNLKRSSMGLIYFIQGLQNAGVDLAEKLQLIGIIPHQIDPHSFITRELEWKIQRYLSSNLSPVLGLTVGESYSIAGYGAFLMLLLSAKNVAAALAQAMTFQHLTYLFGQLSYRADQHSFGIVYQPVQGAEAALSTHAEVVGTYRFIRDIYRMVGLQQIEIEVQLAWAEPDSLLQKMQYQKYFGNDVKFGYEKTTFLVQDHTVLSSLLPTADPVVHARYQQQCTQEYQQLKLKHRADDGLIVQIQQYLHLQSVNNVGLNEISRALHIPERTLRHQLAMQNTSFQYLKTEVLKQKALDLLNSSNYTIEIIAQRLGYAETAAFSHAFKRWFNLSPKQYMQQQANALIINNNSN